MNIYLHIIIWIVLLVSVLSFFSLAPWVPTKRSDLKRIHTLAWLKKDEKFLEIWCGTANVSISVAKQNPRSHITGIELSLPLYIISKIKVFFSRLQNIQVIYGNALKNDMSNYDVIYVFGLPETISQKLEPKLQKEMKPSARMISYCFKMDSEYFDEEKSKPNSESYAIYIYTPTPAW